MSSCEAELCPYWTGQGCACDFLDISEEERQEYRREVLNWLEAEG